MNKTWAVQMFCPRFSCLTEALKNRGKYLLLCPAVLMPLDPATSSCQRKAPLPLSSLSTELVSCISVLLCDLEKPSLVKHSYVRCMAQPPPCTTPLLSQVSYASMLIPSSFFPFVPLNQYQVQTHKLSANSLHGKLTQHPTADTKGQ